MTRVRVDGSGLEALMWAHAAPIWAVEVAGTACPGGGRMYESVDAVRRKRSWSLRREWTRAFVLMLALMLATGACTIFGVWQLVGQFSKVADQRDRETSTVDALRTELVDHEQIGHQ